MTTKPENKTHLRFDQLFERLTAWPGDAGEIVPDPDPAAFHCWPFFSREYFGWRFGQWRFERRPGSRYRRPISERKLIRTWSAAWKFASDGDRAILREVMLLAAENIPDWGESYRAVGTFLRDNDEGLDVPIVDSTVGPVAGITRANAIRSFISLPLAHNADPFRCTRNIVLTAYARQILSVLLFRRHRTQGVDAALFELEKMNEPTASHVAALRSEIEQKGTAGTLARLRLSPSGAGAVMVPPTRKNLFINDEYVDRTALELLELFADTHGALNNRSLFPHLWENWTEEALETVFKFWGVLGLMNRSLEAKFMCASPRVRSAIVTSALAPDEKLDDPRPIRVEQGRPKKSVSPEESLFFAMIDAVLKDRRSALSEAEAIRHVGSREQGRYLPEKWKRYYSARIDAEGGLDDVGVKAIRDRRRAVVREQAQAIELHRQN